MRNPSQRPGEGEKKDERSGVAAAFLKPNGRLPALGDTSSTSPILVAPRDLEDWPEADVGSYLYSASGGVEGRCPADRALLAPEAGYAIVRSGWGERERFADERYLALRLATAPTSHIHRDVFSFELYAYGDDLVVDSGGPFAYGHPLRDAFFLTTAAHNTVVVDGEDQQIGAARVLHWHLGEAADVLVAEHTNVPDVLHRRAIVFVHAGYVLVLDQLVARRRRHYAQLFHLAPSLHPRLDATTVTTVHASNGPTVRLLPLLPADLGLRVQRGVTTPPQGWVCGRGTLAPNVVVAYERTGLTAVFPTLLVAERPGTTAAVTASLHGHLFEEPARIEVSLDGRQDTILVDASGFPTVAGARQ